VLPSRISRDLRELGWIARILRASCVMRHASCVMRRCPFEELQSRIGADSLTLPSFDVVHSELAPEKWTPRGLLFLTLRRT
jgi:hypothetical protein